MFLPSPGLAQAVALDRFGQNDRRLRPVFGGRLVGGVHLPGVVAAAQQLADLLVGQMVDQFQHLRIFAEEMLAGVAAGFDGIFLVIAVHAFIHALDQQAGFVALEQFVPFGAPDDLDDVPARARGTAPPVPG